MAAIPSAKERVRDYGLNIASPASMMALVIGASSGPLPQNQVTQFNDTTALRDQAGEGPGVEAAAEILSQGGGPVAFVRTATAIAAANGPVTPTYGGANGGTITVGGTASLDALVRIEITESGILGAARFRYSLDGYTGDKADERTYSESLAVPAGGTFAIPGLGITLTFSATPNPFAAGDYYTCEVKCAASNATDLAAAFAAVTADKTRWRFVVLVTSQGNGVATAHALLGTALQAQLDTLANTSKYRRGMLAASHGDTAAATVTAWSSTIGIRLLVAHGQIRRTTTKPFPGFGFPVTNAVDAIAARAARSLPSTDLKRVKDGPLQEVVKIFHDEYRSPSNLDNIKVSTLRTFENFEGFYVTQGRLKSPDGSDFTHWPMGVVMDIACETVNAALSREIGRGVRIATLVLNDQSYPGTIDDRDATVIEQAVSRDLIAQLMTPLNAEGFEGHVSDLRYKIVRTHNFQATGVVLGTVGIVGLGYIDYAETTLGFVVELPGE